MRERRGMRKKWCCLLLTAILLIGGLAGCGSEPVQPGYEGTVKALAKLLDTSAGKLLQAKSLSAGESVGDWLAIALSAGGSQENYEAYLEELSAYVTDCYARQGCLDPVKATDYHRVALTVMALGGDPRNFGTDAQGNPVDLVADGIWNFQGDRQVQGLNGTIYSLITLDAGGLEVPDGEEPSREMLLLELLEAQEANGGFGLTRGNPTADMTAMAVQALAPEKEQYAAEIDRALDYLSGEIQGKDTDTVSGMESSESVSQIILALCSLGIDPAEDARFVRNGTTLEDMLDSFRTEGCYRHTTGGEADVMATEQALLAMVAVERLRSDGDGRLFCYTG